jgi:hypothetical protein
MSIRIIWDDPAQTILRWEFSGRWEWTDILHGLKQAEPMMRQVLHTVNFIADISQTPDFPDYAIENIQTLMGSLPVNTGVIIVVGTDFQGRSILRMFQKLFPGDGNRFAYALIVEEARQFLV